MRARLPILLFATSLAGACPDGRQIVARVADSAPTTPADAAGPDADADARGTQLIIERAPTSATLRSLWGPDDGSGELFVVGDGGVLLRNLPDAPWTLVETGISSDLHAIWGFSASELYVGGQGGVLRHFDGQSFTPVESMTSETITALWGSPDGSQLVAVTAESGMAIHLFVPGAGYRAEMLGTPLYGVWGSSPTQIFAVGGASPMSPSFIARFDGTGWQRESLANVTRVLYAAWGTGGSDVWAVGEVATTFRYDGTAWAFSFADNADLLLSIWGSSPSDVWVVGGAGAMQHYNGTDWTIIPTGLNVVLRGVWGRGSAEIVAVGHEGTILRVIR